ncbi:hypothetical protein E0E50_12945 [Azotobacter chroococcum subsp. isscasi]|uniref:hypothetical protein n=1 Tax=Azotobacter chroococcum TaxID=353 RepID=UPI00103BE000|nr:hypothetical protein [Azotobacter chroococcum]TBW09731.1 hypothetical protein E0E50_12945 [Azotobacter chroococcum subsp. isscasi]
MRIGESILALAKAKGIDSQRLLGFVAVSIFLIFIILMVRYQIHLLTYIEWGDESETIVAAKMIAAGSGLYSDIFNHHGPLTFLFGLLVESFGSFGVSGHRVPIALLQLLALCSIYFSPVMKDKWVRKIYVVLTASVMLVYLPEYFGHMYKYQVIAGLLLVIILAQYTLPVVSCQGTSGKWVIVGNLLIGSLPFLAITYAPVSVLLFFASLRREALVSSSVWLVVGVFLNFIFLAYIGSIPGYLAFHFYLNAKILSLYSGDLSTLQLVHNAFVSATGDVAQFSILALIIVALSFLAAGERGFPWRSVMLGAGIGSLLVRGLGFQALPYFYVALVVPVVFFKNQVRLGRQSALIIMVLLVICFAKVSLLVSEDKQRLQARQIPADTEFSRLVNFFTSRDDRIIAYSFQNFQYIASDRLPASGHFFYLPWQEKYNEDPRLGIKIDACRDIKVHRPKVMFVDKWMVWDKYPWESYAGCVQQVIDNDYSQIPGRPYYIRKDILPNGMEVASSEGVYKMQPSPQLDAHSPIRLRMTSGHLDDKAGVKRVGVMFATYIRVNPGSAELRLQRDDGSEFTQRISLPDLADNKYFYFDLDSSRYVSGKIVSITGGGVSTWESHDEKGDGKTCITYEYNNGKRRFTPGCPLF